MARQPAVLTFFCCSLRTTACFSNYLVNPQSYPKCPLACCLNFLVSPLFFPQCPLACRLNFLVSPQFFPQCPLACRLYFLVNPQSFPQCPTACTVARQDLITGAEIKDASDLKCEWNSEKQTEATNSNSTLPGQ